jgi:AraC-like DNA-binding protein
MVELLKDFFRFLPVTELDEQWGMVVTAVGHQVMPAGYRFVAKGHSAAHDYFWAQGRVLSEYAIVYFVSGGCQFESRETGRVVTAAGDALLLFPGVWHRYRPDKDTGWGQYWVTFQGEQPQRLRQRGFMDPADPVQHAGLDERVTHAFTHLLDHVRSDPIGIQQIAAADTLQILAGIRSAVRQQQTSSQIQAAVRRAKAAIESCDGSLPTFGEMAEELGLSRSYFYQVFKEHVGLAPYQYHLQLQIRRAQDLLRSSRLSIKQIARTVKFQSQYQFCRTFKKKTGTTPSEYRRGGRAKRD